ncbi:M23 family metallopeptidase [Catellatospora tritici]|uniref:M23 family metallopeptidase n=1 Tax=Catellatospora tritici TaxID=2851566 RepID=UPI001C2CFC5B|nr:M23 family metallopeptidase [Catellatospora tritici]MBV1850573.1 M23 family metallopeptidase [Catellatospora tritici]
MPASPHDASEPDATPGRLDRRQLLTLVTASLAMGVIPEAWLAEAAYGATPRWNRPFDKWVPITAPFGWRTDPITGEARFHYGTDYSAGGILGYPVRAIAAGTVAEVGYSSGGFGNYAVIAHADGWRSLYGHLRDAPLVGVGAQVAAGQHIGHVGSTGRSTGPHLHLELTRPDGQRVDPESMLAGAPYAGAPGTPPSILTKDGLMYLIWSTGGTGYLVTPNRVMGLKSMAHYLLFKRIINSNQAADQPEVFNALEIDQIKAYLAGTVPA